MTNKKNLYSEHIVLAGGEEALVIEPWEYVSVTSEQLSKWQRVHSCQNPRQMLPGFCGSRPRVQQWRQGVGSGHMVPLYRPLLFLQSLIVSKPDCLTRLYLLGLLACRGISSAAC